MLARHRCSVQQNTSELFGFLHADLSPRLEINYRRGYVKALMLLCSFDKRKKMQKSEEKSRLETDLI